MENEVSLPKTSIKQLVQKNLSPNLRLSAAGLTEVISELANDFIAVISERSYKECVDSGKKTIMPEHVTSAMTHCGFPMNQADVDEFLSNLNQMKAVFSIQSKPKEKLKLKKHGMSDDQLLKCQEDLLKSAYDLSAMSQPEIALEEDNEDYD